MKRSGIYIILNNITNKCYIGQAIDIARRMIRHRYLLSVNRHGNVHLQASYNKYGKDSFSFDILEECEKVATVLTSAEQFWMDSLRHLGIQLYNLAPIAGTNLGCRHSNEAKKRKSEYNKSIGLLPPSCLGKSRSEDTKRKISSTLTGRVFSDETRLKMSLSRKSYFSKIKESKVVV